MKLAYLVVVDHQFDILIKTFAQYVLQIGNLDREDLCLAICADELINSNALFARKFDENIDNVIINQIYKYCLE